MRGGTHVAGGDGPAAARAAPLNDAPYDQEDRHPRRNPHDPPEQGDGGSPRVRRRGRRGPASASAGAADAPAGGASGTRYVRPHAMQTATSPASSSGRVALFLQAGHWTFIGAKPG